MKVIKIDLTDLKAEHPQGSEDFKEMLTEAIRDAVAQIIEDNADDAEESSDEAPFSEVENLTKEEFEEFADTNEDFKTFHAEVKKRIDDLLNLAKAHQDKYNCGIVISATTLCNEIASQTGIAMSGTGYTIAKSVQHLLGNPHITAILCADMGMDLPDNNSEDSNSEEE